jgi:hypothetical protein
MAAVHLGNLATGALQKERKKKKERRKKKVSSLATQ